jgi:hypothetical protein
MSGRWESNTTLDGAKSLILLVDCARLAFNSVQNGGDFLNRFTGWLAQNGAREYLPTTPILERPKKSRNFACPKVKNDVPHKEMILVP